MAFVGALISGIQQGASGLSGGYSAYQQAQAAREAARRAQAAGQRGATEIQNAGQQGLADSSFGHSAAMNQYNRAQQYSASQRAGQGGLFAQARTVGGSALQRYQDAVLNGNQAAVADPEFAIRYGAGANAASQLAGRTGMSGDPRVSASLADYNAGLASTSYQPALERLRLLGALGTQAQTNAAGLDQNSFAQLMRLYGAQAQENSAWAQHNALLRQNSAAAYANALNQKATNTAGYNLQASNALGAGAANISNAGRAIGDTALEYQAQRRG